MATPADRLDYRNLIEFVQSSADIQNSGERSTAAKSSQSAISGEEAKLFYEELLAGETAPSTSAGVTGVSEEKKDRGRSDRGQSKRPLNGSLEYVSGSAQCHDPCEKKRPDKLGHMSKKLKVHRQEERLHQSDQVTETVHKTSTETKGQRVSKRVLEHRHSELLRSAQNGDAEAVAKLLDLDVDINHQDIYGWTALMSAAYEGHVTVLRCLLQAGADLDIHNSQGQTAISLAQKKHHIDAVQLIQCFQQEKFLSVDLEHTQSQSSFYCEVCKREFYDTDQKVHLRSTVHLFSTGNKPKNDRFLIPSSNVGYRLMLKSGWDAQKGLGPSGQGQKYPVKTVLKSDRKGLGNEVREKAKVTHFNPHDQTAVTRRGAALSQMRVANVRTLSRRAQRAKEKRDRQWEIAMRQHLS